MMSGMTGIERAEVMVRMTFGPNQGFVNELLFSKGPYHAKPGSL